MNNYEWFTNNEMTPQAVVKLGLSGIKRGIKNIQHGEHITKRELDKLAHEIMDEAKRRS